MMTHHSLGWSSWGIQPWGCWGSACEGGPDGGGTPPRCLSLSRGATTERRKILHALITGKVIKKASLEKWELLSTRISSNSRSNQLCNGGVISEGEAPWTETFDQSGSYIVKYKIAFVKPLQIRKYTSNNLLYSKSVDCHLHYSFSPSPKLYQHITNSSICQSAPAREVELRQETIKKANRQESLWAGRNILSYFLTSKFALDILIDMFFIIVIRAVKPPCSCLKSAFTFISTSIKMLVKWTHRDISRFLSSL